MNNTGIIFILFTSNNVICSLTDIKGDVIFWISTGSKKSKGLKKSVPIIIYSTVVALLNTTMTNGFTHVHLKFKGLNKNKKPILKAINHSTVKLLSMQDVTACPHNGCKVPQKKRL